MGQPLSSTSRRQPAYDSVEHAEQCDSGDRARYGSLSAPPPPPSPGVFGFVSLLLGKVRLPHQPTIACADALLDLAAEAQALSALTTDKDVSTMEFTPYVKIHLSADMERLSSMNPIERMLFLSDAVRFTARTQDSVVRLFTVAELNELSILYVRFAELYAIREQQTKALQHSRDNDNDNKTQEEQECGICMDAEADCVLPCQHPICSQCEKFWVRRKLDCPFCRTSFRSAKDVARNEWELTLQPPHDEIRRDMEYFESRIAEHLQTETTENIDELLEQRYQTISRQIDPFAEEREGYVFL